MYNLKEPLESFSGIELIEQEVFDDKILIKFKIILDLSGTYSLARIAKVFLDEGCKIELKSKAKGRAVETNAKHLVYVILVNCDKIEKIVTNLKDKLTQKERELQNGN